MVFETDFAVHLGKQRVVFAEADVEARPEAAPALPHENRSARHDVAVVSLDAKPLRIAVAAVAGTSLTLFCCHRRTFADASLTQNLRHADARIGRPVPLGPAHALPALLLEHADLR